MNERNLATTIVAGDIRVKYLIRYHRAEVTLRETLIRSLDPRRRANKVHSRWRQAFWALRGVSLTARPGDVIGVIGPIGSGKTTLLKALAGIIEVDGGRVEVRGRVGCLLSFGVGFNGSLTGRENIYLNGTMLGLSRREIDECIDRIIELSEVGDFIQAPVRTYSRGMKVRLGFSIAVHIDPDVLLLDEALAVGDAAFRSKTGTILERLSDEKRTIVIASHSLPMIRGTCTRVVWLDEGRVRMEGDPAEVCDAYVSDVRSANAKAAPTDATKSE